MFTLDSPCYTKSFSDIVDLINDVIDSGMDPNCEILHNGEPSGEFASDYIIP